MSNVLVHDKETGKMSWIDPGALSAGAPEEPAALPKGDRKEEAAPPPADWSGHQVEPQPQAETELLPSGENKEELPTEKEWDKPVQDELITNNNVPSQEQGKRVSQHRMPAKLVELEIGSIRLDANTQVRASLSSKTVAQYSEAIKEGDTFPPISVFREGNGYFLADGFHRLEAYKQAGFPTIRAQVYDGDQRSAFIHGLEVNSTHGLNLTSAEKVEAVKRLLTDPEWHHWSDRRIAKLCGVSHPTVSKLRKSSLENVSSEAGGNKVTCLDKNGKPSQKDVSKNRNRSQPAKPAKAFEQDVSDGIEPQHSGDASSEAKGKPIKTDDNPSWAAPQNASNLGLQASSATEPDRKISNDDIFKAYSTLPELANLINDLSFGLMKFNPSGYRASIETLRSLQSSGAYIERFARQKLAMLQRELTNVDRH